MSVLSQSGDQVDEVVVLLPVVDVDGYPGPKATRAVLAERLRVPIENEITIEDIIDPSIPPPTAEAVAIFGV